MQKVALAAAKAAVKREKSASGICTEEAVYIQVPHLHAFYAAQDDEVPEMIDIFAVQC